MNIALSFAPFVAFALLVGAVGPVWALIVGAVVSAVLLVRDRLGGRSPKILEIGTFILFAALALYMGVTGDAVSVVGAKLAVDAGLFVIALASMVLGRPFTLQYARETVPAEYWSSSKFIWANYVITGAWALAFAIMVIAEAAVVYIPSLPPRLGIFAAIAALVGAIKFTKYYSEKQGDAEPAVSTPTASGPQ